MIYGIKSNRHDPEWCFEVRPDFPRYAECFMTNDLNAAYHYQNYLNHQHYGKTVDYYHVKEYRQ